MKQIVLFDANGTLHNDFSIFPLFETFATEGYIPKHDSERLQEIHDRYIDGSIGFRTFVVDTLQAAAQTLTGRQESVASRIAELFFAYEDFNWFGYVKPTLLEIDKAQAQSVLITAAPQFAATSIAAALGMYRAFGSRFAVENDGTFAGNVLSVLGSSQKGTLTKELIKDVSYSAAFGDSEGDIGMLELVDQAVCISPTDRLRTHAVQHGWEIVTDPDAPLDIKLGGSS